jgi:hypothetical protein
LWKVGALIQEGGEESEYLAEDGNGGTINQWRIHLLPTSPVLKIILRKDWTFLKILMSLVLSSFFWSHDHFYSKLLSQITTVGAYYGAWREDPYVKIDGLYDQHIS